MRRLWPLLLFWASAACQDVIVPGGICQEDSDCPGGESCLYDVDRRSTYCSAECQRDEDCRPEQVCRAGTPAVGLSDLLRRVCVDRLRACAEVELCNGLDDNCDGTVDEAGCQPIVGCKDDLACGRFVCQAPLNQPDTLCAPPNEQAASDNFTACTNGLECANGLCETGWCSPLCRPEDRDVCPPDFSLPNGRIQPSLCARAYGDPTRPRYNTCQLGCAGTNECRTGQECVWRPVVDGGDSHSWVCSALDPARKPLGAACSNNEPEGGDNECQHGLCYQRRCTRICGGFGSPCSDVDPTFTCQQKDLYYGAREFSSFLCARPN